MARLTHACKDKLILRLIKESFILGGRKRFQTPEEAAKYYHLSEYEKDVSALGLVGEAELVSRATPYFSGMTLVQPTKGEPAELRIYEESAEDQMKDTISAMNKETTKLINPFKDK